MARPEGREYVCGPNAPGDCGGTVHLPDGWLVDAHEDQRMVLSEKITAHSTIFSNEKWKNVLSKKPHTLNELAEFA